MNDIKELFRYDIKFHHDGGCTVYLHTFEVIKRTKCGVWIQMGFYPEDKKFVNLRAYKKYACITKEEAKQSFIERKIRQIKIVEGQLTRAKIALEKGKDIDINSKSIW